MVVINNMKEKMTFKELNNLFDYWLTIPLCDRQRTMNQFFKTSIEQAYRENLIRKRFYEYSQFGSMSVPNNNYFI